MDISAASDAWRRGQTDCLMSLVAAKRSDGPRALARLICLLLDCHQGDAIFEDLMFQNVISADDVEVCIKYVPPHIEIKLAIAALNCNNHRSVFYKLAIAALVELELFQEAGSLLSVALIDHELCLAGLLPILDPASADRLGVALSENVGSPSPKAALAIAEALCGLGNYPAARALLVEVLARGERQQDVWQRLHQLQAMANVSAQERIAELQQILAGDPDNAAIAHTLSGEMLALGWYDDAVTLLQRAVELSPDVSYLWFNLGYCRTFRRFDHADNMRAIAAFERAASLGFDRGVVWSNLISLYCEIGDAEKVREGLNYLPAGVLLSWWPRSSPWPEATAV